MTSDDDDVLIPDAEVRRRYGGVCRMTIRRWEKDPRLRFPPGQFIRTRKYRRSSELRAFDERIKGAKYSHPRKLPKRPRRDDDPSAA